MLQPWRCSWSWTRSQRQTHSLATLMLKNFQPLDKVHLMPRGKERLQNSCKHGCRESFFPSPVLLGDSLCYRGCSLWAGCPGTPSHLPYWDVLQSGTPPSLLGHAVTHTLTHNRVGTKAF